MIRHRGISPLITLPKGKKRTITITSGKTSAAPSAPSEEVRTPRRQALPKKGRQATAPKQGQKPKATGKKGAPAAAGKRKRLPAGDETTESFALYIRKVLSQVHPEMTMSKKTAQVLNSMVVDLYGRLTGESKRLLDHAGKKTLSARDIQAAVRLLCPGELGKHAVSEGTQAVMRFTSP